MHCETGNAKCNWVVEWSEEDHCFIGYCPGIVGPCCHGDDEDEVYRELRQIVEEWLEFEKLDKAQAGPIGNRA